MTTTIVTFSAVDYKGVDSLSSYATPITPLKFIPDLDQTYKNRIVWDFGDGSYSRSFSPSKTYTTPGIYHVNMVIYDCDTNAQVSFYERELNIYDFFPDTFTVEISALTAEGVEIDHLGNLEWNIKCGKIDGPLIVKSYSPSNILPSSIYYDVSGGESLNWWDIENGKFSHLENFYCLYETKYNYAESSCYFNPIQKIDFDYVPLYGRIEEGDIVYSTLSTNDSQLIGYSGEKKVYLKNDTITEKFVLSLWKDKTVNPSTNNTKLLINGSVIANDEVSDLSITSNGLDGEGFPVQSFNISPVKFFDTNIPFVIRVKDSENFTVKDFDELTLSAFSVNVLAGSSTLEQNTHYSLSSLNYTLSSQNHKGSFRGYISFPLLSSNVLSSVVLSVGATLNSSLTSYVLTGTTSPFSVYSKNYYDIWKTGEDFNPQETLKDLRFQETMLDKTVLFEEFLGPILGNEESDHEAIGVKIYEKIKNYVKNTKDVDICEKDFIESLGDMVNYSSNGENYNLPVKVKRIVDLASISRNDLIGELNKFRENFDIRGNTSKEVYGRNIGNEINPSTYTILSSSPIVALEKFSGEYTLLNTYQPLSSSYPLSSYSSDWGWPLVLPRDFPVSNIEDITTQEGEIIIDEEGFPLQTDPLILNNFEDIVKYYLFFEYNNQYDNSPVGSLVDYGNSKTTIGRGLTNNELFGDGGVFEIMLLDSLYQSLSI